MKIKHQIDQHKATEAISQFINDIASISLNEAYNHVIDALVDAFGKNLVFSNACNYVLSQSDLVKIFNILNNTIFDGKIKRIPIVVWPKDKLIDKINYHCRESGVIDSTYTNVDCYAVHSAICSDVLDDNGKIIDVNIRDDYLIVNQDKINKSIFIFVVAVICHEMIHLYDRQVFKEYHDLALKQSQTNKDEDFHQTQIFQDKMNRANAIGINVVEHLDAAKTHTDYNNDARYVLKKITGENESSDTMIVKNDQMVFMKNKKTGKGVLMHFD